MHVKLDIRPETDDISADGLTLAFTATPGLHVVGTLDGSIHLRSASVTLPVLVEVLAASHRVRVFDASGPVATEQVACIDSGPTNPLTAEASNPVGAYCLEFRSDRQSLTDAAMADLAADIRRSALDDAVLAVSFPGHADAMTSVRIGNDGWETWHLYPGDHPHAVRTRTTVTIR